MPNTCANFTFQIVPHHLIFGAYAHTPASINAIPALPIEWWPAPNASTSQDQRLPYSRGTLTSTHRSKWPSVQYKFEEGMYQKGFDNRVQRDAARGIPFSLNRVQFIPQMAVRPVQIRGGNVLERPQYRGETKRCKFCLQFHRYTKRKKHNTAKDITNTNNVNHTITNEF